MQTNTKMSQQDKTAHTKKIASLKQVQNELKKVNTAQNDTLKSIKRITAAVREYQGEWQKVTQQEKIASDKLNEYYENNKSNQELLYKAGRKARALGMDDVAEAAKQGAESFLKNGAEFAKYMFSPEMLLLQAGVINQAGLNLGSVFEKLKAVPEQMDEGFRNVVKQSGLFVEGMKDTFVDIIDPSQAA